MIEAVDSHNIAIHYQYDALNRLVKVTDFNCRAPLCDRIIPQFIDHIIWRFGDAFVTLPS